MFSASPTFSYTLLAMKIALQFLGVFLFSAAANAHPLTGSSNPDIRVYKTVGDAKLTAHVFHPIPSSSEKLSPAILLFHGGGWVAGSPEWVYQAAQRYAQYGAVAIAVEYRLCDQKSVTPLDSLADARDVLRWTRNNAADLGIDPSRIAAYGVSAGGQLAAALATIDDTKQHGTLAPPMALVMISPAVSVIHDDWFQRILLDKAPVADLSPDEHITKRLPPTLIFHGAADTLVPIAGVRRYCERAKQQGSDCTIVEYPSVGHLFTRKLDSQESDFDPDPTDVADSQAKGDAFLAKQGFLPKFAAAQQVLQQLQPPANEQLLLQVHAKGDQIYTCKGDAAQFIWNLKASDARLFDKDGKPFGKHFAGPSWEANDGSRVTGKAVANAPSPDADSIPWLLVNIVRQEGTGVLSRVTTIQRLYTKGDKAPSTGCDAAHAGQELRAPYSADYLFYATK